MKYIKISDAAKKELSEARIVGNILHLNPGIKNYAELKKIFEEIGVQWRKKEKCHFLQPGAVEQIDFILNGGKLVDEKKTLQAFYTPLDLVERVVEMADVEGKLCLEPSCGDGRMVKEMLNVGAKHVDGLDINLNLKDEILKFTGEIAKRGYSANFQIGTDFLTWHHIGGYERIVMNPPYDKNTWVKHISYAWTFLKTDGKLVAICPNNEPNKQLQKFLEGKGYEITDVEAGAFKESGTMIRTMILEVWK